MIPLRECNYGGSTLSNKTHTILVKSRIYTSLVDLIPPNSTARWSSIMVREKELQGGGLVPLSVGEDHVPVRVEGKQCTQSIHYLLTANLYSGTSE